jgi:hypothetical protein
MIRAAPFLALLLPLAACCRSYELPAYYPIATTAQALQDHHVGKVSLGTFDSGPEAKDTLARLKSGGASIVPAAGQSFVEYIAAGLRREIERAGCFDPSSPAVLSGTLVAQKLSVDWSFSGTADEWEADLRIRFVVRREGTVVFDKTLAKRHGWTSVSLQQISGPKSGEEYLATVQLLLRDLFSDPDFAAVTQAAATAHAGS